MAFCRAQTQLLDNDFLEDFMTNDGFQDFDDSSSGYDSADTSDCESSASEKTRDFSRDSYVNLLPAKDSAEEMMNFQSTHALCENLKLILAMPSICDVTFLVGPREIPVHGVRAILGTRSRIFYQLILKNMAADQHNAKKDKSLGSKLRRSVGIARPTSEKLVIPVTKYDAEVFRLLIQFVHCGSVNITEDTVAGLFCGAIQFDLPDLARACLDFVERCLKHQRTEQILSSTRAYSHHKATEQLFQKIYSVLDRRYTDPCKHTAV